MVTLPDKGWRRWPGLLSLIETLGGSETTRAVGGAVRDTLLGLPVSDVDLATRLSPDEVIARVEAAGLKAVPTGLAHGTITAVVDGRPVEVTTLRRDVATDGRRAIVEYSDDWREDAARRDFTINALYADVASGEVVDYFDGLGDLDARRVRFIGEPLTRIAEDHLRILRFFRFHARFGQGEPDAAGLAACAARANDLMALSRERIAMELLKLLGADDPAPVVATMIAHGIIAPVIPEFTDAALVARCVARESDLGMTGDPVRRLAAMIGPNPALAGSLAARLKLSKADTKRLTAAADPLDGTPEAVAYRRGLVAATDQLVLGDGTRADAAHVAAWDVPRLPISGGALIARGLEPGPAVAQTLARIEDRWIAARFPTGSAFDQIASEELSAAR